MSDLYKTATRGYLIDHHSPAPPIITFDHLKSSEYEDFIQKANINSLMLYCKDHWGYCYYDTKVGVRHPALKEDFVKTMAEILRRNQVEFNAYYCIEYDCLAPELHPEWSTLDLAGNPVVLKGRIPKWGMPCYLTRYRKYVLEQLTEIVTGYHPDSLFLDIFGKSLCYCPACKEKFLATYGYPLPERPESLGADSEFATIDFGDKGRDINQFLETCALDMFKEIRQTLKSLDSSLAITINFSALYPKALRDLLDYQFTEPWAGNWLSAAYARDTALGQYPQLGPGDVSEVYNYQDDAIYQLAAAQIAANGCRPFIYSGSQHVDGTLEFVEAEKVGKAFQEVKAFEAYLGQREVVTDILIVQSESSSRAFGGSEVTLNAIGRCKKPDSHRKALLGAMKLCDVSGYSWRLLPEQSITKEVIAKYSLVILAGFYHVTPELKEILVSYQAGGGALLADGQVGLYDEEGKQISPALADVFGYEWQTRLDRYKQADWGAYLKLDRALPWENTPDTQIALPAVQYGVALREGKSLGNLVFPCTEITDKSWVNWWCPPPAKEVTFWPGITEKQRAIYLAFDFFSAATKDFWLLPNLFMDLLARLLPHPLIRFSSQSPKALSVVTYRRGKKLILHQVSHLAEQLKGTPPEIDGGIIRLDKKIMPISEIKRVFPAGEDLIWSEEGEYQSIQLPPVKLHQVLLVSLDQDTEFFPVNPN